LSGSAAASRALIAICALGCALPVNVAGIILNRLVKDIRDVETGEMVTALQSLGEADSSEIEALYPPPEEQESLRRRRSSRALWWSLGFAALSSTLTAVGLMAALWHVAWWVGAGALATALVSATLVIVVYLSTKPAESERSRALVQRYTEHRLQEALQREDEELRREELEPPRRKGRRAA